MLSLIFLPLELAIGLVILPLRIIAGMLRSARLMAIILIGGVCSLLSGVISLFAGSFENLLPWILIAAGIFIIVRANKAHPEVREECFKSFYSRNANTD